MMDLTTSSAAEFAQQALAERRTEQQQQRRQQQRNQIPHTTQAGVSSVALGGSGTGSGNDGMLIDDDDILDEDEEEDEEEEEEEEEEIEEIHGIPETEDLGEESEESEEEEEQYEGPFFGADYIPLQPIKPVREGGVSVIDVDELDDEDDEMIGPRLPVYTPASPIQNRGTGGDGTGGRMEDDYEPDTPPLPPVALLADHVTGADGRNGQEAMDIDQIQQPQTNQPSQPPHASLSLNSTQDPLLTPAPVPAPVAPTFKYGGPDVGKGYEAGFHWPSEIRARAERKRVGVEMTTREGQRNGNGSSHEVQADGKGEGMDVDLPAAVDAGEDGYSARNGNDHPTGVGRPHADHGSGNGVGSSNGSKHGGSFDKDLENAMNTSPARAISPTSNLSPNPTSTTSQPIPSPTQPSRSNASLQPNDFDLHFNLGFLMRFRPDFEQLKRRMNLGGGGLVTVGRSLERQAREGGWGIEGVRKGEVQPIKKFKMRATEEDAIIQVATLILEGRLKGFMSVVFVGKQFDYLDTAEKINKILDDTPRSEWSKRVPYLYVQMIALQEFRSTHSDEVLAEPSKSKLDIGQDFLRQRESLAGAGLTDLLMVPYSEEFRIPKEGPKRGVRVIVLGPLPRGEPFKFAQDVGVHRAEAELIILTPKGEMYDATNMSSDYFTTAKQMLAMEVKAKAQVQAGVAAGLRV